MSLLKLIKKVQGWRQFSKGKKSGNVRLLKFDILIILIDNIVVFGVIDNKSGRCAVFELAAKTDIDPSNIPEIINFPFEVIELLDFGFDEFLFFDPDSALLVFEQFLFLFVGGFLGLH